MRRRLLVAFVCLYAALGVRFGRSFSAFGEETIVQPGVASTMLVWRPSPDGPSLRAVGCREGAPPHALWLDDRPRWSLCAGGRVWPVMLAGYLGGFLFWPLGLASAALGDDLLLRRALSSLVGLIALALGARLARESEGEDGALLAAMALATSPTFVVTHAIFLHYETAPATLAMLAAALYARDLRRGALRARTLWLCAGLLGLALAVNLRAGIVVVALALTAWRLRAPFAGTSWAARAGAVIPFALGMSPVLLLAALDPGGARDDRSGMLSEALAHNRQHPEVLLGAGYDVLRWWSNLADYLSEFNGPAGFNPPALGIAAAAAAWVLLEGLRALWRREGSALAAALALTLLGYWVVGAMIYLYYPRNMAPLGAAFGLSLGLALTRLSAWLGRRGLGERVRLGLCALLTLPFAYNVEQLVVASLRSTAPYNLVSERAMGRYLDAHPLPGSVLVSMDLYLAGVFEGLGRGGARVAHAEPLFYECGREDRACRASRVRALLDWCGARPTRIVMLAPDPSLAPRDRGPSFAQVQSEFRDAGARVSVEHHAPTPRGTDGILLLRVYRDDAARSSASTGPARSIATRW